MILTDQNRVILCPRSEGVCPHGGNVSGKRTCFIMMAYEEEHSVVIENILKRVVKSVLKLEPVLATDVKKMGSTDMFCTKVCKEIMGSTYCIADITYKNTNVGIEYGYAQGLFGKPVILTQYIPKAKREMNKKEKNFLEKLKKTGIIQYSSLPLNTASDLLAIYKISYSDEKELKQKLKEAVEIKVN